MQEGGSIKGIFLYVIGILFYQTGAAVFKYALLLNNIESCELFYWIAIPLAIVFYIDLQRRKFDLFEVEK